MESGTVPIRIQVLGRYWCVTVLGETVTWPMRLRKTGDMILARVWMMRGVVEMLEASRFRLSEKMPAARPGVRYGMANLLGPRVGVFCRRAHLHATLSNRKKSRIAVPVRSHSTWICRDPSLDHDTVLSFG